MRASDMKSVMRVWKTIRHTSMLYLDHVLMWLWKNMRVSFGPTLKNSDCRTTFMSMTMPSTHTSHAHMIPSMKRRFVKQRWSLPNNNNSSLAMLGWRSEASHIPRVAHATVTRCRSRWIYIYACFVGACAAYEAAVVAFHCNSKGTSGVY